MGKVKEGLNEVLGTICGALIAVPLGWAISGHHSIKDYIRYETMQFIILMAVCALVGGVLGQLSGKLSTINDREKDKKRQSQDQQPS